MRTLKTSLSTIAIALMMASCSQSILDDPSYSSPDILNQRIDMVLEGAVETAVFQEGEEVLISIYENTNPLAQENERVVRIDLDGSNSLDLIFYNAALNDPLSEILSYATYPFSDLSDKTAYVVINYTSGEGEAIYSTSPIAMEANIQPNVLEIRDVNSAGFNARIRDLTLYEVEDGSRSSRAETTVRINGTFIANN